MAIKVSFILGILNAERTLDECLKSIFNQNYPKKNYEVIIIDGGSSDSTLEIVKKYQKKYQNINLRFNPNKLSEGKGMSKDIGLSLAKGQFVIFLDHDNILLSKNWLIEMLKPFKNKNIQASQSLLAYTKEDNIFIKYINSIGVEDPFAIPYSLVSQVNFNNSIFNIIDKSYYLYNLDPDKPLFGGANGCVFRKEVFKKIGGYTRDVDIFHSMSELKMIVAIPLYAKLYHKSSPDLFTHLIKKGIYFRRFIKNDIHKKKFSWTSRGKGNSGKIRFCLIILGNLILLPALIWSFKQFIKTRKFFWFLHPFILFYITLEYGLLSLLNFNNFLKYFKRSN